MKSGLPEVVTWTYSRHIGQVNRYQTFPGKVRCTACTSPRIACIRLNPTSSRHGCRWAEFRRCAGAQVPLSTGGRGPEAKQGAPREGATVRHGAQQRRFSAAGRHTHRGTTVGGRGAGSRSRGGGPAQGLTVFGKSRPPRPPSTSTMTMTQSRQSGTRLRAMRAVDPAPTRGRPSM